MIFSNLFFFNYDLFKLSFCFSFHLRICFFFYFLFNLIKFCFLLLGVFFTSMFFLRVFCFFYLFFFFLFWVMLYVYIFYDFYVFVSSQITLSILFWMDEYGGCLRRMREPKCKPFFFSVKKRWAWSLRRPKGSPSVGPYTLPTHSFFTLLFSRAALFLKPSILQQGSARAQSFSILR